MGPAVSAASMTLLAKRSCFSHNKDDPKQAWLYRFIQARNLRVLPCGVAGSRILRR
jgi:hypothetical protein